LILSTLLGLSLLGQVALSGDNLSVDEAIAKSRVVIVATPWNRLCLGGTGTFGLMQLEVLKGEVKDRFQTSVNILASGKETWPEQPNKYVFFLVESHANPVVIHPSNPTAIKVLPYSPELVASLKGKLKKDMP
jgi:hypothetical protein